jgi:hypothetical protein
MTEGEVQGQAFYPGPDLRALLEQGVLASGDVGRKGECLDAVVAHLEAASHTIAGPRATTAILSLEYALMQLGNAIALVFKRSIENRPASSGTHELGARIVVEYCKQRHQELVADAVLAFPLVTRRNAYAYRHEPVNEIEVKRLGRAMKNLYVGLRDEIATNTHFEIERPRQA